MTKEEIEELIEAEVSRRMATMTAQFGRDLSEMYMTKAEVEGLLQEKFKGEVDDFARSMGEFAEKVKDTDLKDPDHPLSFLVSILSDIGDLHLRVMEIGMYILAKETKTERGPGAMEKMMHLSSVEATSVKLVREHFLNDVRGFKNRSKDDEALRSVEQLEELLGEEPEPDRNHRPN